MIPDELFRSLEERVFTASIGVVSTPRALKDAILDQLSVRRLLALLSDPDNRNQVLGRALQLLRAPHDARYCHPDDLPIAIYLRALELADPSLALKAADLVLQHPNLWWARSFALSIVAIPGLRVPVQISEYTAERTRLTRHSERATSTPLVATSQFSSGRRVIPARIQLVSQRRFEPQAEVVLDPHAIRTRAVSLAN